MTPRAESGGWRYPLARLGFEVTGIDLSPHLVGVANKKAEDFKLTTGRARFLVGDMRDLGSRFAPSSFDAVLNVFTSIGYGSEEDDLRFFRDARAVTKRGGLLLISGLRNRDYIARNPSQNVYEESERLLVLDTYSFDSARSRERGVWRFYLKSRREERANAQVRGRVPHRHQGLLAARARLSGWKRRDGA